MTIPAHSLALLAATIAGPNPPYEKLPSSTDADDKTAIVITGHRLAADRAVGATKVNAPILEAPQAISVVEDAFINMLKLRTVAEALNYTSGVRSQASGSDTRIEYYQLRGFASSNFFKDGLALYNSGAFLSWTTPAEGIERLEILKGPASVLYGSGSAGGLVNIASKAPLRTRLARIEAGVDEYGSAYASADFGGPIRDTLAFRAIGLVRRGDTQVEMAEDNRSYGALALAWTPLPDTKLTLRGSYTGDRSNRPTGFVPYAGFVTPLPDGRKIPIDLFVSDPSVDPYDRNQYEVGYTLESQLSKAIRLVSNGRYGRIDLTYAGLYGAFTGNPVPASGRYYLNRAYSRQDAWLDNIAFDNHVEASFATGPLTHDLLVGIDDSFSTTASVVAAGAAPRLDIFDPQYGVTIPAPDATMTMRQKLDQTGLYVQDRIKLGRLVALLSARHDWIGITAISATGAITHGQPSKATYRAGISYVTPFGLASYLSYATSFTPVIGVEAATGNFYRPETGASWEAGIKFQPQSLRMIATASLFTIERDGVLVSNPVAGFPANQSQLGRVRSRGGEVEVQVRPVPTLSLTASLTAFNTENRAGAPSSVGKTPTATPELTASGYVDFTFPKDGLVPGLGFGAGVRHVGESYADVANTLIVPSATVYDAALHYTFARFKAAVNISNLFDEAYVAACPSAGVCYAANLRRATFSLAYSFGEIR
ncbi:TonB-dependent siderophore receptor [Sphingomonas sp. So64.6b]|uniref:TonB-dependent siderophore receptor n=1 Tax=Sphingomonas sp. So64.6b TaxID=2997354 RepID=UPI0016027419|nr:TonB-dependent siderophore receptor [Sphingomonas sp. So64.6b]QNA85482.1 TonB-dependent siderophore receptor [Sphingomonas sp. So64.6b]